MLLTVGDTVCYIRDIYKKHKGPYARKLEVITKRTPTRAKVHKDGFLVHTIKVEDNPKKGVKNEFIDAKPVNAKKIIMTIQHGNPSNPFKDCWPVQAIWAKLERNRQAYTFMGIFELNPQSTDAKRIYDRICDKYDTADPDWEIIGIVR
jgi:hypothetical protein